MVAKFSGSNLGPANNAGKKNEKSDMYDFTVPDCTQEQNGSPY